MKRFLFTAVIVLLGITPVIAQGLDIDFKQPPTREAAGGDGVPGQIIRGGVYMVFSDEPELRATTASPLGMLTLNADTCADSTPLWTGEDHLLSEVLGAPHGTWGYEGPREITVKLYFLTTNGGGLMDMLVRATVVAEFAEDLSTGKGQITFESFLPFQADAAMDPTKNEEPLGGFKTRQIRLVRV